MIGNVSFVHRPGVCIDPGNWAMKTAIQKLPGYFPRYSVLDFEQLSYIWSQSRRNDKSLIRTQAQQEKRLRNVHVPLHNFLVLQYR